MNKFDNFRSRAWMHDTIACPTVDKQFSFLGYDSFVTGAEIDDKRMMEALKGRTDQTSMAFRYRPDKLFVSPKGPSIACEIKSEFRGHDNYAIEFDSYAQTLKWGIAHIVIYAFVNIKRIDEMYFSWANYCLPDDISFPKKIFLPDRYDYESIESRIKGDYPNLGIDIVSHKKGSGTPYFLINKNMDVFKSLPEILC